MRTIHKFSAFEVQLAGADRVSQGLYLGLAEARANGVSTLKLKRIALYYLLCPFIKQRRRYRLFLDYEAKNKYRITLSCLEAPVCEYDIRPLDNFDALLYKDFVFDDLLTDHLDFMLDFDNLRHEWSSLAAYLRKYLLLNESGLHGCRNLRIYSYYKDNEIDGETVRSLFGFHSWPFLANRDRALAKLSRRSLPSMA